MKVLILVTTATAVKTIGTTGKERSGKTGVVIIVEEMGMDVSRAALSKK